MKAEKLKSGNWRVRVYDKASKKQKSITMPTRKAAEKAAIEWYEEHSSYDAMRFYEAAEGYISKREAVLSPTTIKAYRDYVRMSPFRSFFLYMINDTGIQNWVNDLAKDHSAKTVKNQYSFLMAVLASYLPDKRFNITLPKIYPPKYKTPSEADIKRLLEGVKDTPWEVSVILGICGLRRGEICALELEDIHDTYIDVRYNKVRDEYGAYVKKNTKTAGSTRQVPVPPYVVEIIRKQGYVEKRSPMTITNGFPLLLDSLGIDRFRFHDLRAFYASALHSRVRASDVYIQKTGGWTSNSVLKSVYTRLITEEHGEEAAAWNEYFESLHSVTR